MNVVDWSSDIDRSPSHRVLDEYARQRVERTKMFTARVEHFDFTVQSVPSI